MLDSDDICAHYGFGDELLLTAALKHNPIPQPDTDGLFDPATLPSIEEVWDNLYLTRYQAAQFIGIPSSTFYHRANKIGVHERIKTYEGRMGTGFLYHIQDVLEIKRQTSQV